jgi:hypothetical protein
VCCKTKNTKAEDLHIPQIPPSLNIREKITEEGIIFSSFQYLITRIWDYLSRKKCKSVLSQKFLYFRLAPFQPRLMGTADSGFDSIKKVVNKFEYIKENSKKWS